MLWNRFNALGDNGEAFETSTDPHGDSPSTKRQIPSRIRAVIAKRLSIALWVLKVVCLPTRQLAAERLAVHTYIGADHLLTTPITTPSSTLSPSTRVAAPPVVR